MFKLRFLVKVRTHHMRSHRLFSIVVLVFAVFAVPAYGQSDGGDLKIGAGVFFDDTDGSTTVTVPILLPSVRLEPQLGYSRTSRSVTGEDDESDALLEIGGGVFKTIRTYERTDVYLGGRIGLIQRSQSAGSTTLSETGFFVGPALGGEYALGDHFSLGVEAGLFYRGIPTPEEEDLSLSTVRTNGRAFLRVYL